MIIKNITMITFLLCSMLTYADCGPSQTPDEAISSSDSIFIGEVLDSRPIVTVRFEDDEIFEIKEKIFTFKVYTHIKGSEGEQIEVITGPSSAMNGFPFKKGTQYLVYANEKFIQAQDQNYLYTSFCSLTKSLSIGNEEN